MPSASRLPLHVRVVSVVLSFSLFTHTLPGNPTGGVVAAGVAAISGGAGTLTVNQTSSRAIIHWRDFSIGAGELTRFVQPDAASATLNRVLGGNPSALLGDLRANGRVFLINPNGILVGAGARIDTAGFLASTLDVRDSAFLAGGDLLFSGDSTAAVTNLGSIGATGGDIFLIARKVDNRGTLSAPRGTVGLAAGSEVLLTTGGDQRVFVQAGTAPGEVVNAGEIAAATAELKAAGGNPYALAINNTGVIRATGTAERDGQVWLVATTTGGLDGRARHAGEIVAANADGRGGFVETSGATVELTGAVRTGAGGHWLIDPTDVTIDAALAGTITAAINNGTGMTIEADNTITVAAGIAAAGAGDLNLMADIDRSGAGTVIFESGIIISNTGSGDVNIFYNPASYASPTDYAPHVSLSGGGALTAYMWVHDVNDLQAIGASAATLGGTYALSGDIDASGTATWNDGAGFAPIGSNPLSASARFSGLFDGRGHVIDGLVIHRPGTNYVGLFGAVGPGGRIFDVGLTGGGVTGNMAVGALAGRNSGTISGSHAAVDVTGLGTSIGGLVGLNQDGSISLSHASGKVTGAGSVGGLAGFNNNSLISHSHATGEVTGTGNGAGGLLGENTASSTVEDSHATGTVTGSGAYTGGLVGNNLGVVRRSHAEGDVSGGSYYVGGLAGQNQGTIGQSHASGNVEGGAGYIGGLAGINYGRITQSHAAGNVSGTGGRIGGLVGANSSRIGQSYATGDVSGTGGMIGGLVGFSYDSSGIDQAYATGTVTGDSSTGGFVGWVNTGAAITRSYWDADKNADGGPGGGGLTGLGTAAFQSGVLPAGLDGRYWEASAGAYPVLKAVLPAEAGNMLSGTFTGAGAGVGLTLVIGGVAVASTTTGEGGVFMFEYEGAYAAGTPALVYAAGEGAPAANRLLPLGSSLLADVALTPGWVWATSGATTLTALLADMGATIGGLADAGILYSVADDALALAAGIGLRLELTAGAFDFNTALNLPGHTLHLASRAFTPGAFTATGALTLGGFMLERGNWTQNTADLPAFSAEDFRLEGGSFLRVTGGDGSEASPYLLADIYGLQGITGVGRSLNYALAGNIDAGVTAGWNGGAGFVPIGGTLGFSGSFDGRGHTIEGLVIDRPSATNTGLFGIVNAAGRVADVGLVEASVRGGERTGGLAGWNSGGTITGSYVYGAVAGTQDTGGLVGYNAGKILGGHTMGTVSGTGYNAGGLVGDNRGEIDGSFSMADVTGTVYAGGLAGWQAGTGTITSSYATGAVSGSGSLGGLAGWNSGLIEDSHARGNVTATATGDYVGGLAANNSGTIRRSEASGEVRGGERLGGLVGYNSGKILQSHATGAVAGSRLAGGLVGWNAGEAAEIRQSHATGAVSVAESLAGGLAGMNTGAIHQSYATGDVEGAEQVGGLVGYLTGAINESYSTGKVTGGSFGGGLVGHNIGGSVGNSYWDTETSGQPASAGGGTGLSTAALQSGAALAGFDPAAWEFAAGAYPMLRDGAPAGPANMLSGIYAGAGEGVLLSLVIGGQVVATTITGPGGLFTFGYDGGASAGTPALVYAGIDGAHGAGRIVPVQGSLTANVSLLADWLWVTSRATTLGGLIGEMRTALGELTGAGLLYSFDGDRLALASGIGLRLETLVSSFRFDTALDLAGHALHLTGWTRHEGEASLKVGTFILDGGGSWTQNAAELPEFVAEDFRIQRGNFLRVTGGDGSEASPWVLVDTYGLQGVSAGWLEPRHYVLGGDIDLSGAAGWNAGAGFRPIGHRLNNVPFLGTFDGDGHTLSGLTIDSGESSAGLFAFVGAGGWVGNLILTDVDVRGTGSAGAVAGSNHGTIERVEVRNGTVAGGAGVGGMAGDNWGGVIRDSFAAVGVTGSSTVGGLVGENGHEGRIERSTATGNVTATGYGNVGGLVGQNRLGGVIEDSRATGNVTGVNRVGGLVGQNGWGIITRSFAEGAVTATGDSAGGLVGGNLDDSFVTQSYATGAVTGTTRVGGLVGYNVGLIDQSFATGAVTGTTVGGLVGSNVTVNAITNSYWDRQTTGRTTSSGSDPANGLTTAELTTGALPQGFDLAAWTGRAGQYPLLRWTMPDMGNIVTGTLAGAGSGVHLTLVVGGVAVATATTGAGGTFTFDFAESFAAGTSALVYVNSGEAFVANRVLALEGLHTGGFSMARDWAWVTSGATTLGGLMADLDALRGALSGPELLYTTAGGVLGLSGGDGLRLELTAGHFDFDTGLNLEGYALRTASPGSLTAGGAVRAGTFVLESGDWVQNAASLPEFGAADFRIEGGSFLRVVGGEGTAEAPWLLADVYGLQGITGVDLAGHWALAGDIDASGTAGWNDGRGFTPIGLLPNNSTGEFTGLFDGRGHVISGLVIDRPEDGWDLGLFGVVGDGGEGGRVRDVGLVGGRVVGLAFIGGLAGTNYGTISGSHVSGMFLEAQMSVGGLVGENYGLIERSHADVTVTGTGYGYSVGGLAGFNSGTIRLSHAGGEVSGSFDVGGLVGSHNFGLIDRSYATASVSGAVSAAGGLVGMNFGDISQSYATGAVGGAGSDQGGLVGAGYAGFGSVTDSYWNRETTGQVESFGSLAEAGLTSEQMRSAASFAGWDIDAVGGGDNAWRIYEGHTAPLLKAFLTTLTVTGDSVTVTYNGGATHALGADDYTFSATPAAGGVLGSAFYTAASANAGGYAVGAGTLSLDGLYSHQFGYDLVIESGSLTIDPKVLTVSLTGPLTKTYDGTAAATLGSGNYVLDGLVGGESFTIGQAVGAYNSANVADAATITASLGAGDFTAGAGTLASNYMLPTSVSGAGTITAKEITVTANGGTSTYGDAPANPGFTADGLVNGETVAVLTGLGNAFGIGATTNAGDYTLSVDGTLTNGNYAVTARNTGTWVVAPRELAVSISGLLARIYDGTAAALLTSAHYVLSGLVNGDAFTVTQTAGAYNSPNVADATQVTAVLGAEHFTATGATLTSNYVLPASASGAAGITPATLTYVADAAGRTYGAANPGLTGTVTGFVAGETVAGATAGTLAFTTGAVATSGVGAYAVAGGGLTANHGNYVFEQAAGNATALTIDPAGLKITADNRTKTYGGTVLFDGTEFTAQGLQNGETVGGVTLASDGAASGATVAGGPYDIVISGATGGTFNPANYDITYAEGVLTVTPKAITVTANGGTSTYGDAPANPGFTADGLVNGETVAVLAGLANAFGIGATTNAGEHTLAVEGTLTNGNYTVTARHDGTWIVSPKAITVTANGGTSTYGDAPANPGFTADGLVNGETVAVLAGLANAFGIGATTNAGEHTLAVEGTLTNGNYTITARHDGTWVISPKEITVTANGGTSTYGDAPANPGFTADGLVNGETVAVLAGLANAFGIGATTNAGEHTLAVEGALTNGNYTVTARHDGTWIVSPKEITVTANGGTSTYGDAPANPGFAADGLVNGETVAVLTGLENRFGIGAATNAGDYTLSVEGALTNGNYTITARHDGTWVVLPKAVTESPNTIEVGGVALPIVLLDAVLPVASATHAVVNREGRMTLVPLIDLETGEGRALEQELSMQLALVRLDSLGRPQVILGAQYRDGPGAPFAHEGPHLAATSFADLLEREESR